MDLLIRINLSAIQRGLEIVQLIGIGFIRQNSRAVVIGKSFLYLIGIVVKIQHKRIALIGVGAVETRERLHSLNARKHFIYVHYMQQRLVIARLKLIRTNQKPIGIFLNLVGNLRFRKTVQRRFTHPLTAVIHLTRKSDNSFVRAIALVQIVADGVIVFNRHLNASGYDHRPRLSANFARCQHLLVEVVNYNLGFEANGMAVRFHIVDEFLLRLFRVKFRIICYRLGEMVIACYRRIIAQHIQNKPLLNRLFHRIVVE